MGGLWSSRTCSLAPDKLSNAPIYDLCGQLNHPGQRCSLGDLFDQRDCQCEQWVSLAFLEGNLVDPPLIVRESVADLADSVFEPVDRISQLQFLSHCHSPSSCRRCVETVGNDNPARLLWGVASLHRMKCATHQGGTRPK